MVTPQMQKLIRCSGMTPKCGLTLNNTLRASGEEELSGTRDQRGVVNEW